MNFVRKPANSGMPASENSATVSDRGQERRAVRHAAEVRHLFGAGGVVVGDDRREGGHVGDDVAGHVQQQRAGDGVGATERRDAHEHVADLADAGVGQQALDVVLLHRDQVPDDHRDGGDDRRS